MNCGLVDFWADHSSLRSTDPLFQVPTVVVTSDTTGKHLGVSEVVCIVFLGIGYSEGLGKYILSRKLLNNKFNAMIFW